MREICFKIAGGASVIGLKLLLLTHSVEEGDLFLAIINRNRDIIHLLLDHGADGEVYLPQKRLKLVSSRNDLVEELIACRTIPAM